MRSLTVKEQRMKMIRSRFLGTRGEEGIVWRRAYSRSLRVSLESL